MFFAAMSAFLGLSFARGFLISLLAVALLCLLTTALRGGGLRPVEHAMRAIGAFLGRRGLFRAALEVDRRKLDFLRIIAGLVLLHRTAGTGAFIFPDSEPLAIKALCGAFLAIAACFTVGFATPVAALLIFFLNIYIFDPAFVTSTLGSDVLGMTMLIFAFAPAGTSLSLDAAILRKCYWPASALRAIYRFAGLPTRLRMRLVKWAALLSYSLLCIYSVTVHLHEPLWLNGDAALFLMTSTYLSRFHDFFQVVLSHSYTAILLAKASMLGMVAWYLYLLPFTLIGGLPRKLALTWSVLFFLFSLIVLQLGSLAYYEFILFALLFWNGLFLKTSRQLDVIYDDKCNLCDRTVRTLKVLDIFRMLRWRPISKNEEMIARLGLSSEVALRDLYGIDDRTGALFAGYDLYLELSRRLLLLVWLFPVAMLGRAIGVGPAVYRFIADRRVRLFGVCRLPTNPAPAADAFQMLKPRPVSRAWFAAFFLLHAMLAVVFSVALFLQPQRALRIPLHVAHVFELAPINVFNRADLGMSSHWFTLEAQKESGEFVMVPVTAVDGGRLAWQGSDKVYFGNTLGWRRGALVERPICYRPSDDGVIAQEMDWFSHRHVGRIKGYRVSYYYQPLPRSSTQPPYLRVIPAARVCTVLAQIGTAGLNIKYP